MTFSSLDEVYADYELLEADDRYRLLIVALILLAVQDRSAAEILALDIEAELARFELTRQLSSNRTQGVPNMIALIRESAGRLAA